jgi:hypothetical protein
MASAVRTLDYLSQSTELDRGKSMPNSRLPSCPPGESSGGKGTLTFWGNVFNMGKKWFPGFSRVATRVKPGPAI